MAQINYGPETCGSCGGSGCTWCDFVGSVLVAQPAKKCGSCGGSGCTWCEFTGWGHVLKE